jgi:hypothetical protein
MKKSLQEKQDLKVRLASYAASTGALLALGSVASGQVVYSGIQNIGVDLSGEYLEIDMDSDGINDFGFYAYGYTSQYVSGSYNIAYGSGYAVILNPKTDSYNNSWIIRSATFTDTYSTSMGGTSTSTYYLPIPSGLSAGVVVDSAQTMWSNISYPYYQGALAFGYYYAWSGPLSSGSYGFAIGDFFGQEKYLGVRFFIGTEQHYGWIRVSTGERLEPVTIVDWAYETTPGDSIITGAGDDLGPEAILEAGITSTLEQMITVSLSFNERAYDFNLGDLVISNGSASNLVEIAPGLEYAFDVTATAEGEVMVSLPAGDVTDILGNENALTSVSWDYVIPVALGSAASQGIKIYPNPVKSELNIILDHEARVRITDLNGRLVYQQDKLLDETIDVSGFNPGVYVVQIQSDAEITQHKIVIE